jgi:hypothetical protein
VNFSDRGARLLMAALGALAIATQWGCSNELSEAEEQRFARQLTRENAVQRHRSRIRAKSIERALHVPLRRAIHPFEQCEVEYRPAPQPRNGVLPVSCGDFGPTWPLWVDHGYMRCDHWPRVFDRGRVIVFTAPKGGEFAVNDAAHAVGYMKLVPLLRAPNRPRVARQPLIDRGRRLCD